MRYSKTLTCGLLFLLAACQSPTPQGPDGLKLEPISYGQLPGWQQNDHAPALQALNRSCSRWKAGKGKIPSSIATLEWSPAQVMNICSLAELTVPQQARAFFETYFTPYASTSLHGKRSGLLTGYYEPILKGSMVPGPNTPHPVWSVPADLVKGQPYRSRQEIDQYGLEGVAEPLVWVNDPVGLFFLHIQGSGRVQLPDGRLINLAYANKNNREYVAIGKLLIDRGELTRENVSMQSIKAWLKANPDKAQALLWENPSYVFFTINDKEAPIGAEGTALTPQASLAVDPAFTPYGLPLYVATFLPETEFHQPRHQQWLVLAQDTGGAIKGPLRGDMFLGLGEQAEALAGEMKQPALFYYLLPRQGV